LILVAPRSKAVELHYGVSLHGSTRRGLLDVDRFDIHGGPTLVERRQSCFSALLVLLGVSAANADRAKRLTVDHDGQAAPDCSDVAGGAERLAPPVQTS
jgi:hypothetical protein